MLIPRLVAFDHVANAAYTRVLFLPSENIEFIDYDVRGKTEAEILKETHESCS